MVGKFVKALDLLERAAQALEEKAPDDTWFRDLFLLTGQHMICTEEGWQSGDCKSDLIQEYGEDYILDEVNVPAVALVAAERAAHE